MKMKKNGHFGFNPEKLSDYLNKYNLTLIEDMGCHMNIVNIICLKERIY